MSGARATISSGNGSGRLGKKARRKVSRGRKPARRSPWILSLSPQGSTTWRLVRRSPSALTRNPVPVNSKVTSDPAPSVERTEMVP